MSAETLVYVLSPVRQVTPEQSETIAAHVEDLSQEGIRVFNPIEDAPQQDETGLNIVLAEINFLHQASQNGGRVDILWNAGGNPSEGSRVDLGIALALGLEFNLVTIFNEDQSNGTSLGLQIIREIELIDHNTSRLFIKISEMLNQIRSSPEVFIDWRVEMQTVDDEWQRIYLGLALGCMVQNPNLKIKLGRLDGVDPEGKKSYPKVIQQIEVLQSVR